MQKKAVIFDLDGVIVSTDEYHYQAWQRMSDEEGLHFDRTINENLRGVSRMESLEIILRHSKKSYGDAEKVRLPCIKNLLQRRGENGKKRIFRIVFRRFQQIGTSHRRKIVSGIVAQ